jgi:hypothetical protein
MKAFVPLFLATASISPAAAQPADNARSATQTMAALLAEGFEQQTVQIFKDKIWMRKDSLGGIAYICDRGRLGSATFEAYREKRYDQISCSLAQ